MKKMIVVLGVLAVASFAAAEMIVDINEDGTEAVITNTELPGSSITLSRVHQTAGDGNDCFWVMTVTSDIDWTNAAMTTTVDIWDDGDTTGGFPPSTTPAYHVTSGSFIYSPAGANPPVAAVGAWPSLGTSSPAVGPVDIDWFDTATNAPVADAYLAGLVIPDGAAGEIDMLHLFAGGGEISTVIEIAPDNTIVPEPATMSLLGLGGIAAVIRRRRK